MDVTDVELRSEEVAGFLRQEVQGAPYRTLVMALIAGYVLAGGLTPRLVWLLVTTGGRAMAGNLVDRGISRRIRPTTEDRSMTIKELSQQLGTRLPEADDLLRYIGLQQQRTANDAAFGMIGAFALGTWWAARWRSCSRRSPGTSCVRISASVSTARPSGSRTS